MLMCRCKHHSCLLPRSGTFRGFHQLNLHLARFFHRAIAYGVSMQNVIYRIQHFIRVNLQLSFRGKRQHCGISSWY